MTVPTILFAIVLATLIFNLTEIIIECFGWTKKEKDIEKMDVFNGSYVQALREMEDYATYITRKHDDQIVYKVDGDFNGDIKGDNVTVILMGDGNINGNIESKDGNVVLIKGNINGDIKANKIVCPTKPTTEDKDQHICKSCYHYVQTPTGSYCTKSSALGDALPVGCNVCKSYDGTGETTKYKSDCARFSNRSGICHFFHVNTCNLEHNCPYKIKRDVGVHCKEEHVDTPPEEIIEHVHNRKLAAKYVTCPIVHIKCPNCGKYFAKQLRVQTTILDGIIVGMNVEEMRHDY